MLEPNITVQWWELTETTCDSEMRLNKPPYKINYKEKQDSSNLKIWQESKDAIGY